MANQLPNFPVSSGSPSSPVLSTPSPSDVYYELEKGRTLREYIDILIRRKWWIIATFLTIVFLAALYTFTRTPIYRATAMIEITADNPGSNVSIDSRMMGMGWVQAQKFQETQNKILKSRSLAKRVIGVLDLGKYSEFAGFAKAKNKSQDAILNAMAASFVGRLDVEQIRNTNLVNISFLSADKSMAQKVVDAIPSEFLYLLIEKRNQSFSLVRDWLNDQLDRMAEKVQETQKKLFKFGQKTDIYMIGSSKTRGQDDNVIIQKFVDLSALLTKAQSEKMAKEAQYKQIKEEGPNAPLIVNNPLIALLRQELVAQQSKVSAMGKIYLSGHPEMQAETAKLEELRKRLNAEVKRVQDSVKADYKAASRTEHLLQESFAAQKRHMASFQDNLSNYQILQRDAQTSEQLYQALLSRVKEVNISSNMVASNVSVIDPPTLPISPFSPRKLRNMALAIVLGLILGVVLALLVDTLDDTIKSTEDLEKHCNLPLLGTLPSLNNNRKITQALKKQGFLGWRILPWFQPRDQDMPEVGNLDLVVYKHPHDPMTEALRHLETSIMLSVSGRPPAAIMVTSPNPSEGKSMVASNLAQALASQGRATVFIDCDLRKPRVHKIFDFKAQPGLTNYLTGSATREEILRETVISNLAVIPAGPQSPTPSNLLNSEIYKDLLIQLRQQFDHIIIDTPPVLGFSDARIISVLVDGALLVTRYNSTHKTAARLAIQLLCQVNAPLMGGVLNGFETSGMKYGRYQYYNYKLYSQYYREKD
jgi:succinoglycan biosynthesis transport protein ExoP